MKSTTAGLKLFLVWSWKEWIVTECKKRDAQTTEDGCHLNFSMFVLNLVQIAKLWNPGRWFAKFGTKPDPQPLWFFHLVKASLVKLAKFGNIYHSGHKILISVLAAFHKAKKPEGLRVWFGAKLCKPPAWMVWGLGGFSGTWDRPLLQFGWANQPKPNLPSQGWKVPQPGWNCF